MSSRQVPAGRVGQLTHCTAAGWLAVRRFCSASSATRLAPPTSSSWTHFAVYGKQPPLKPLVPDPPTPVSAWRLDTVDPSVTLPSDVSSPHRAVQRCEALSLTVFLQWTVATRCPRRTTCGGKSFKRRTHEEIGKLPNKVQPPVPYEPSTPV